jgi:molybdopterin-containing oxidoreductase family iron-sulfur binding subunit
VNDKESSIHKLRKEEQVERTFYVLEHIHTLPNINYLSRIRNTAEVIAGNEKKDGMYTEHI